MSKSKDSKQDIIKIGIVWFRNDLRIHDNILIYVLYIINKNYYTIFLYFQKKNNH